MRVLVPLPVVPVCVCVPVVQNRTTPRARSDENPNMTHWSTGRYRIVFYSIPVSCCLLAFFNHEFTHKNKQKMGENSCVPAMFFVLLFVLLEY